MSRFKLIAAAALALLLVALTLGLSVYKSGYESKQAENAALLVQLSGLQRYILLNQNYYDEVIQLGQRKHDAAIELDNRIKVLESLLEDQTGSDVTVPESVYERLHDRASRIRAASSSSGNVN